MKANSDKHIEDLEKDCNKQTKSINNLTHKIGTMEDIKVKQDDRITDFAM